MPRSGVKTWAWAIMILIETGKFKTFDEYLASLGKAARKNYRFAKKNNPFHYRKIEAHSVWVQEWMDLWGRQLIRGQNRPYAFNVDALQGKNILYFSAFGDDGAVALQFVEVIDGYMNCHPVMYEKEKYADRYLSKFMWFGLIKWAIDQKIAIVDLGGGNDDDWHEMIRTREQYPNPAYKWMYVPSQAKFKPKSQQNYKVIHEGISKRISKID